jgi:uncharacterized Rmd1/YagE family protein
MYILPFTPDTFGDFFKDTSAFYSIDQLVEIVNRPIDTMKDYKDIFKNELLETPNSLSTLLTEILRFFEVFVVS